MRDSEQHLCRSVPSDAAVPCWARSFEQVELQLLHVAPERIGRGFFGDFIAEHPHVASERRRSIYTQLAAANNEELRRIAHE